MTRKTAVLISPVLTALTMGLEFAHALELPRKMTYSGSLYVRLQEWLHVWFGNIGSVLYVASILMVILAAIMLWRARRSKRSRVTASLLQVAALGSFFSVVYPVNLRLPIGQGIVPDDWAGLRSQWETGHAVGFILFAAAFAFSLLAVLRQVDLGHPDGRASPEGAAAEETDGPAA